jgi:regulator of PEP synthase PpsR (kinase-PPPase family)
MNNDALPADAPIAFFVSDGSGVSAEAFGETLLSQMDPGSFRRERAPFCKTPETAKLVGQKAAAAAAKGLRVCVFSTLAMPATRQALLDAFPSAIDLFAEMLPKASAALGLPAIARVGASHGAFDAAARDIRAEAIDYALSRDDGARADYSDAEIILVGVSRSGKTPCCMWLAMHYGLRAANYPLAEEDFASKAWPGALKGLERRCAGLTLSPERLSEIRHARLKNSRYASLETCRDEIKASESMLRLRGLPIVDTTGRGVEEICAALIERLDLRPALSF